MDNILKIYYVILVFICAYAVIQIVNMEHNYISECCKANYRQIMDKNNDTKFWCLECKM